MDADCNCGSGTGAGEGEVVWETVSEGWRVNWNECDLTFGFLYELAILLLLS